MKSRVVMPPPGDFTTPDRYSRKQWRRVQHVANGFWDRWRKEVLLTIQNRKKWNNQKWNCQVGDIVLLRQEADWNRWPMARIVNAYSDSKGNVRSVRLLLGASDKSDNSIPYLERPENKVVVLVKNNNWKGVFQEICGRKWTLSSIPLRRANVFASRCCNVLRGAICKGTWTNGQPGSESHAV